MRDLMFDTQLLIDIKVSYVGNSSAVKSGGLCD